MLNRLALALFASTLLCSAARAQQMAITMDDLPSHSSLSPGETREDIARRVLAAFKAAGVPQVYGFINGVWTEREPQSTPVLQMWRHADYPLGNHTWSHKNLNDLSAEDFEAEIAKNEPLLQQDMGSADWHWLRFPFLSEGNTPEKTTAIRTWLAAHHYRIAAVTISFPDYALNEPYARCKAQGDATAAAMLENEYLKQARANAEFSRDAARAALGRDIPHVLLMHIGTLDAVMLPKVLAMYKAMGWKFTTLEQAEQDPYYTSDIDPSLPHRTTSLAALAAAKHAALPAPAPHLPDLNAICAAPEP